MESMQMSPLSADRSVVNRFYNSINEADALTPKEMISLFGYFLVVELGKDDFSANAIDECFRACDLKPSTRTRSYLSEGIAQQRFVKTSAGYRLQRRHREDLAKRLGSDRRSVQTSAELRNLERSLRDGSSKGFLAETLDCFEAGANRASVIMCWILVLDHLIDHVMAHHLTAFNDALNLNTDSRVKIKKIRSRDDFNEIPENKLLELLRVSQIISKDVRKILDEKLGIRNSCAHPSGIKLKSSKACEFIEDLVENVILKYPA